MNCPTGFRVPVYVLVIVFGMGSWLAVNGMWVELPILVHQSPEGWNLPSYIIIISQVANIGPLLYTLLHHCTSEKVNEKHGIYFIVIVGAAACLLLVFFWKETSPIGGVNHSTGLLFTTFLLSLADCTSSVVFLPYMARFKPQYISALYIGENLSGMVPGLVSLGQNVGKTECVNKTVNQTTNETAIVAEYVQPKFPVEHFFYFLFAMMILCGLAFALLHYLPYCKQEHASRETEIEAEVHYKNGSSTSHQYSQFKNEDGEVDLDISTSQGCSPLSKGRYWTLLAIAGVINAMGVGILSSVSSYATLPYGDQAYHLSTTLSLIANPLVCVLFLFVPLTSMFVIGCTASLGLALGGFILTIAAFSPSPPLVEETGGAVLIVTVTVLCAAFISYCKVSLASVLRLHGHKALLWCGIVSQIGVATGAILMFLLVNQFELFHQKNPCT